MVRISFLSGMILCIFLSNAFFVSAQSQEEEKELEELITGFTKAFSEVRQTEDKESVLKYFDPSFTSDLTYVRIGGTVRNIIGNYKKLSNQLENLITSKEMFVTYKLQEITKYSLKGDVAVVPFINNFEVKRGEEILVAGSQLFTFTLRKKADQWVVVHYALTEIEDQRYKGACLCEIFTERNNVDIVSKTTFPSGSDYKTEYDEFDFRKVEEGTLIIQRTDQATNYLLDKNNKVHVLDKNQKPVQDLGEASNNIEAILLILKSHIYETNCLRIIQKK